MKNITIFPEIRVYQGFLNVAALYIVLKDASWRAGYRNPHK